MIAYRSLFLLTYILKTFLPHEDTVNGNGTEPARVAVTQQRVDGISIQIEIESETG